MIFEEYNEQEAIKAAQKREEERFNEGKAEGIAEATTKEKVATVHRLNKMGLSAEQIAEGAGISVHEVWVILRQDSSK